MLKILGFLDLFLLAAQSAAGKTAGVTLCCLITPISQTRLSDGTKGVMLLLLLLSLAVTSLHFNLVNTDQASWLWQQINLTKHQSQVVQQQQSLLSSRGHTQNIFELIVLFTVLPLQK